MSSWPTEMAPPGRGTAGPPSHALLPGGMVGQGRYRLLSYAGADARCNAQLWRARDGQLGRDVALTLLLGNQTDARAAARVRRTVERAMHGASYAHPGVARILDVLSPGNGIAPQEQILGIVVAEWTNGTDLIDLIADGPLPAATASRLLEPLAAAVEGAHHAGLVLGTEHPQRIRVTPEGQLRLAFPGPRAEAASRDDVKGLGAILYLLLTGRWALPGGPEGLPVAPVGPNGSVVAPRSLHPMVPHSLSTVAVRSLEDTSVGGIRTGAAILQVLDEIAEAEAETGLIPAVAEEPEDDVVWTTQRPVKDSKRSRKLAIGVTALAVATLLVLGWIAMQVVGFFNENNTKGDSGPPLVISQVAPTSDNKQSANNAPTQTTGPVKPASISVFNVASDPDSPKNGGLAIDGDPNTSWRTDKYLSNFPALKPGIGLMASFGQPVKLAQVVITSPSAGTKIEIRTAPSDNPQLQQTLVVGSATLAAGDTTIPVKMTSPSQRVIVWITSMSPSGKLFASQLSELKFIGAR
ncbi:protein kinase family protein [Kutzneria sp. CA-103260]|uniref:protein kinase family protein n=1 Tax=Kutzneria sp. CA-103260 TaxID=2802641 RepID=UPI001BEEDAA6|nr:protein kinase family protein [Kutzneria sp. CA-103260]QUQ70015.1 integral membrane protein MviN [Kutzneria sp. CA-103260]